MVLAVNLVSTCHTAMTKIKSSWESHKVPKMQWRTAFYCSRRKKKRVLCSWIWHPITKTLPSLQSSIAQKQSSPYLYYEQSDQVSKQLSVGNRARTQDSRWTSKQKISMFMHTCTTYWTKDLVKALDVSQKQQTSALPNSFGNRKTHINFVLEEMQNWN